MTLNGKIVPAGTLVVLYGTKQVGMILEESGLSDVAGREYVIVVGETKKHYWDDEFSLLTDETERIRSEWLKTKEAFK